MKASYNTIETTHKKIMEKLHEIDQYNIDHMRGDESTRDIREKYDLDFAKILCEYYSNKSAELTQTELYYRTLIAENYVDVINTIIDKSHAFEQCSARIKSRGPHKSHGGLHDKSRGKSIIYKPVIQHLDHSSMYELVKYDHEMCCNTRMELFAETSELYCHECNNIKKIVGSVMMETHDGTKQKTSGYDTIKHYKFWLDRIQAIENKVISDVDYSKISIAIKKYGINIATISCDIMRNLLKDPSVMLAVLNDHVALLVKLFSGRSPPMLDFTENKLAYIKFNKIMELYNEVINQDHIDDNRSSTGHIPAKVTERNKPYYPYFIYKIFDDMFPEGHPKREILEFIHLQSRDTVIKNDKYYEQICLRSSPEDGLVYRPTKPR